MIKKVTLVGLGAIGSWLADKLERHLDKNFRVLVSDARRERYEKNGITINGTRRDFQLISPELPDDPADLILIAVKRPALEEAVEMIRRQVGPKTIILSTLNGIDSEEVLIEAFGAQHVLYAYMFVSVAMKRDTIEFDPAIGRIHFGELKNEQLSGRVQAVRDLFEAAGVRYRIEPDMQFGLWRKFLNNVGHNLTCALLGVPFGVLGASADAAAIKNAAMREVVAVANKLDIPLTEAMIAEEEQRVVNAPFHLLPSTLQDLLNGKPTEIEMFGGHLSRLGKRVGVPTPVTDVLYHGIRVLERKNLEPSWQVRREDP